MADTNYHIGNYSVKTTGNLDLSCDGNVASFQAAGEEGRMVLTAQQSVGVFSGGALAAIENNEPGAGKIALSVDALGTIEFKSGPPIEGARVRMEAGELMELAIGPPAAGASITMTPESITFKVAETSLTLSAEGIVENVAEVTREVTPQGHNMTAAETEMNVGVQGVAQEGPTEASEVEGGTLDNETLGSHTTDALKNEDAGLTLDI